MSLVVENAHMSSAPDLAERAGTSIPPAPSTLDEVLERRFGLTAFRPWQREAIDALLDDARGQVLVVAPTGGGKSLTYQLPAAVLPGLTVVISPLVALMEDQVRGLTARGIRASFLASTVDPDLRRQRERDARAGRYELLYCAPERLASDWFVDLLRACKVDFVAVDEAHCISQWGHDFRPDYLRLGDVIERLAPRRVLACTATATPRVREEIITRLRLRDPHVVVRGFARENLHLEARHVEGPKEAKRVVEDALLRALGTAGAPKGGGIVYCATRRGTEQLADHLDDRGFTVAAYHAGMEGEARASVNARFASGALPVVVATNAFGMGIDRPDVRVVVHAQPPGSLEGYYQEVGRAGRDGEEAHGLLLASGMDVALRRRLCELGDGGPAAPEIAARQWGLFRELLRYLDAGTCRHDFILRYFGDEQEVLGGCGHCDVCADLDERGEVPEDLDDEGSLVLRKALAGVARARGRGGLVAVAEMLRGERSARVEKFGFDQLSTFSLLAGRSQGWVLSLLRGLLAAGWIDLTATEHPVPFVTEEGARVMRGNTRVRFRMPLETRAKTPKERTRRAAPPVGAGGDLFEALRAVRVELAKKRRVPPYVVAHDSTLLAMATTRPGDLHELRSIPGMGPYRIEAYGEAFLAAIRRASP